MISPPSKLKMFTGSVCVLLTSVSLKLIKIKIKLIYATTSLWEKKNGGWKLSDTDWFYFSFYNPSFYFLWSELIQVQFCFIFIFLFDPSWSESIRVDPTRTGGPSWSSPTFILTSVKTSVSPRSSPLGRFARKGCFRRLLDIKIYSKERLTPKCVGCLKCKFSPHLRTCVRT